MIRPISKYYHTNICDYLKFVVPPGHSVLFLDPYCEGRLKMLEPSRGVAVHLKQECECGFESSSGFSMENIEGKFDYIVLYHILAYCNNIGSFLRRLTLFCTPNTRIIIVNHSYLWTPIIRLAEIFGTRKPGGLTTLLSSNDLMNYMAASGFQFVNRTRSLLCPLFLMGIGPLINFIGKYFPLFDWAKLNQFSIFRTIPSESYDNKPSLTVCLTCRDEKECIEPLVNNIPSLAPQQEILFVEGHSTDGTLGEIERVIKTYADKNIRVISQPGTGQGDAIREGFANAKGNIIILLEADMTSPPENIAYAYDSMRFNQAELFQGSRFVYSPLSVDTMPFLNQLGNWFFALFFSCLLGQHMTDVLSGIKAIHKQNFQKILARWGQLGIKDPFGDFELLFGAMRLGLKTAELPIHYRSRPYGKSKTRAFFHGWLLLKMSFVAFTKFRR